MYTARSEPKSAFSLLDSTPSLLVQVEYSRALNKDNEQKQASSNTFLTASRSAVVRGRSISGSISRNLSPEARIVLAVLCGSLVSLVHSPNHFALESKKARKTLPSAPASLLLIVHPRFGIGGRNHPPILSEVDTVLVIS